MGKFEKFANDWEARLRGQQAQLHSVIPSTKEETTLKALADIKGKQQDSYNLAYKIRQMTRKDPAKELLDEMYGTSIPSREHAISLPAFKMASEKKALLGPLINPIKHGLQDVGVSLRRVLDEQMTDKTKVTDEPSTLPWYYPKMTLDSVQGFRDGYRNADDDATAKTHSDLDTKIELARSEFEKALADEYRSRRSKHASTAGELIDGLAEKAASGELNIAAGTYGALASLLGAGAYQQAKQQTEDQDPRVMKMKAIRDLIRARMRSHPPMLHLEPELQPELAKVE